MSSTVFKDENLSDQQIQQNYALKQVKNINDAILSGNVSLNPTGPNAANGGNNPPAAKFIVVLCCVVLCCVVVLLCCCVVVL